MAERKLALLIQRLQCSSFLVMTYFLRDYNILPKKELLLSLWVMSAVSESPESGPGFGLEPNGSTKHEDSIPYLIEETRLRDS